MKYPSQLIENAVNAFKTLPGIGEKTALRLVLHMLKQDELKVHEFSEALTILKRDIKSCDICFNLSDSNTCDICANKMRSSEIVCVVENMRDVIAIESTGSFHGKYHVLGGVISPVNGIGPDDLNISALIKRVSKGGVKEIIMALSPNMEGDTTIFFISKQLANLDVNVTTIARGISFGGELEYADELTLSRSIATRTPYENYLIK